MSITVIVENDTIKLPVHVPDGTPAEIFLPGEPGPRGSAENIDTVRVFIGRRNKDADDLAVVR